MSKIHFEVDSEINPKYLETGDLIDYYGIYKVVKYDGDEIIEVLKVFDDPFTNRRMDAYKFARSVLETAK